MAISYSFFGRRKKSTKSLTFATWRDLQITKDRPTDVDNPQTDAQLETRMLVALCSATRSKISTKLGDCYSNVRTGTPTSAEFQKLNTKKSVKVIQYSPNGHSSCGLAEFQISRGGLPELKLSETTVEGDDYTGRAVQNLKAYNYSYKQGEITCNGVIPEAAIKTYGPAKFLHGILSLYPYETLTVCSQTLRNYAYVTIDEQKHAFPIWDYNRCDVAENNTKIALHKINRNITTGECAIMFNLDTSGRTRLLIRCTCTQSETTAWTFKKITETRQPILCYDKDTDYPILTAGVYMRNTYYRDWTQYSTCKLALMPSNLNIVPFNTVKETYLKNTNIDYGKLQNPFGDNDIIESNPYR